MIYHMLFLAGKVCKDKGYSLSASFDERGASVLDASPVALVEPILLICYICGSHHPLVFGV
jgi:hypothetical protein